MRTNINIDDDLLTEAMAASGLSTKKATVEEALRRLVQGYRRRADMTGLGWDGDLGRDAGRAGDRSGPVIVIDSSVWIGLLRNSDSSPVRRLRDIVDAADDQVLVGDLILFEVLQGARDEAHAAQIERASLLDGLA